MFCFFDSCYCKLEWVIYGLIRPPNYDSGGDVWMAPPAREACRVLKAQIEFEPSTLLLKVQETPELWPEQSARVGTPVVIHDQIRQVGRSQKPSHCLRTVQRNDWAGITRAAMPASGRDWLPTHPTG